MSDYERNKGKLFPATLDEIYSKFPDVELDDLMWDTDGSYIKVGSNYYFVEWEVKEETDFSDFADVKENGDGSIDFHTYHYNGCNHWTGLVEDALRGKN